MTIGEQSGPSSFYSYDLAFLGGVCVYVHGCVGEGRWLTILEGGKGDAAPQVCS